MDEEQRTRELSPQALDYVTAAARAALGMVPFAGSLLAELAGTIIPNQRIDRISKFAVILEEELAELEQDFIRSQLTNENFTDLVEEGMRQAAHSLSDERREYLANLIGSSLNSDDIKYVESKHLLRILGEINDIEVIWLRFYAHRTIDGDEDFRSKHQSVLAPIMATMADPPIVVDKETLQTSYKEHLVELGLLRRSYAIDSKTKLPEYDSFTGEMKVSSYQLSALGRLLLRYIGLADAQEE